MFCKYYLKLSQSNRFSISHHIKMYVVLLFFFRRETINRNLGRMTMDQQEAFGLWYSKVLSSSNITTGDQSFIRDTGNLIAYLPFYNFQHLTSAQVTVL